MEEILKTAVTFIIESVKEAVAPYIGTFVTGEFAKLTAWLDVGDRRKKLKTVTACASVAFSLVTRLADGTLSAADVTAVAMSALSLSMTAVTSYLMAYLQHKLSKAARGS